MLWPLYGKCVLPSSVSRAATKNKGPHKCRGVTALKVTEANVRQELDFRPRGFTNLSSFYFGYAAVFVSRSKHLVHHTHCPGQWSTQGALQMLSQSKLKKLVTLILSLCVITLLSV